MKAINFEWRKTTKKKRRKEKKKKMLRKEKRHNLDKRCTYRYKV